jgi:hypothetical protein
MIAHLPAAVLPLLRNPVCRPGAPRASEIKFAAFLSGCGTLRWELRRWWHDGAFEAGRILPWISLNPSRADSHVNDPTLLRLIHFTWFWGFDGLALWNLWPFRSPDVRALKAWLARAEYPPI